MFVECFVNSVIPESFTTNNSRNVAVGKQEIERRWQIKDKIKVIIPQIVLLHRLVTTQKFAIKYFK
jgi:hypothetical protein